MYIKNNTIQSDFKGGTLNEPELASIIILTHFFIFDKVDSSFSGFGNLKVSTLLAEKTEKNDNNAETHFRIVLSVFSSTSQASIPWGESYTWA